jgi:3-methyladenine DNA glycosylase AlkC
MAERLKDMFFINETVTKMADEIKKHHSEFDKRKFMKLVFDENFESKELKERMRHVSFCLHEVLPNDYKQAIEILKKAAPNVKGFEAMCLPDFVEVYGQEDWDTSLPALKHFTQFASSEFAIRPFLDKDPQKGMQLMHECADDRHENVRRFASEGCRPRLPWAIALPKFKKDPNLILPVLEKLKNDNSEFVRRSVANNLNDISKDNPEIVLDVCEKWYGQTENTNAIVKHACRSLLKAGNKRALILFGFGDPSKIKIENLELSKKEIKIGDELHFSFDLKVNEKKESKIRLEYAVFYMKANGKSSKKVFQIIEKEYSPGLYSLKRKQSFMDMTTRKHYPGEHQISIIVNGEEKVNNSFELAK